MAYGTKLRPSASKMALSFSQCTACESSASQMTSLVGLPLCSFLWTGNSRRSSSFQLLGGSGSALTLPSLCTLGALEGNYEHAPLCQRQAREQGSAWRARA